MEQNNSFVVKKLPDLPHLDGLYNVKIDTANYIVDKENLLKLRTEIDKILTKL